MVCNQTRCKGGGRQGEGRSTKTALAQKNHKHTLLTAKPSQESLNEQKALKFAQKI